MTPWGNKTAILVRFTVTTLTHTGTVSSRAARLVGGRPVSNFKGANECSKNGGSGHDIAVVCNWQHAVLTYSEALLDRIASYRIAIFCVILYRIVSCPLWLYRAITIFDPVILAFLLPTTLKCYCIQIFAARYFRELVRLAKFAK